MCAPFLFDGLMQLQGYRRVKRPFVRFQRLHSYAADRFADATTPNAVRFWRGVMGCCVSSERVWEKPNQIRERQ